MIRRTCASLTILLLLAACGGGGTGKSGSLPPTTQPSTKKTGSVTFSFKLPGKSTMTKVRRRFYQSQATLGVGIDWTSATPSEPDYAAPISATCPSTLPAGVVSCGIDPVDGGTDYTFELSIPEGTYSNFTVTTFDQAPSGSPLSFASSANMLAQGQLPAPVKITAGTTNTIPSLTFYGIPSAVSLVAGPAQSHVTTYDSDLAVIGNAPQNFFVEATDADGFVIDSSDSGAPVVTVAEDSGDSPQHFAIASTSTAYEYTFTAVDATGNATIDLTATPGGSGLAPYTATKTVIPVQELWLSQSSGEGPPGIVGIPLYPPNYAPAQVLDFLSASGCGGCDWEQAALAPTGAVWSCDQSTGALYVFSPAASGLTATQSALDCPSEEGLTIDSAGRVYLLQNTTSTIYIYNSSGTLLTSFVDPDGPPFDVAVAPANVASGMAGTIWLADSGGITVFAAYSSGTPAFIKQLSTGAPISLSFDPSGNLWVYDSESASLTEYAIGSSGGASIGQIATSGSIVPPGYESQFAVSAQGSLWLGAPGSYSGMDAFTLSGSTINLGSSITSIGSFSLSGVFSTMIAP